MSAEYFSCDQSTDDKMSLSAQVPTSPSSSSTSEASEDFDLKEWGIFSRSWVGLICFLPPMSDVELEQRRGASVPKNTSKRNNWAMRVLETWIKVRNNNNNLFDKILQSGTEIGHCLTKFVVEVRKQKASILQRLCYPWQWASNPTSTFSIP